MTALTPEQVREWLRNAQPGDLAAVGTRDLLIAAYHSCRQQDDPEVKRLALKLDDILRRLAAEEASPA